MSKPSLAIEGNARSPSVRHDLDAVLREHAAFTDLTGHAYLEALVRFLSDRFGMSFAFLAELNGKELFVQAAAERGETTEPHRCCTEEAVAIALEDGAFVRREGGGKSVGASDRSAAQAGICVRLADAQGQPLGVLCALSDAPLRDAEAVLGFMKISAARAGAELDRARKSAIARRHELRIEAENSWLAQLRADRGLPELLASISASANALLETAAFHVIYRDPRGQTCSPTLLSVAPPLLEPESRLAPRRDDPRWSFGNACNRALVLPVVTDEGDERLVLAVAVTDREPVEHEIELLESAARVLALEHRNRAMEAERQRRMIEDLFRSLPEAAVILDRDDHVVDVNPRFCELFQFAASDACGVPLNDLIVPPEFAAEAARLSRDALLGRGVAYETFRRRRDGTLLPVSIQGASISHPDSPGGYFAIYRDRTQLHEAAERIDFQSRHDLLTGLPNRYEFERRLAQAIKLSRACQGVASVIHFDLDQFKVVNDTAGHVQGDVLLQEVTHRVKDLVRAPDVFARLGGDEFAILLVNARPERCEELAQEVRARLAAEPFRLDARTFTVTASFGIVTTHGTGRETPQEVLSLADSACFLAKERGRNRVQRHASDDAGVAQRRAEMNWISRINEALLENRFALYVQRIAPVHGVAGIPHGELLLRMLDREGNRILPPVFIPPAERYNLMPRIDRWVLNELFSRLGRLPAAEQENQLLAVNISGSTLSDEGLADFILDLFRTHDVRPQSMCFEITETAAIANFNEALEFIRGMQKLGCRIALDDFGSGLSSFRYLKQFTPDFLKIDGSFVREITRSATDYSMVEAINRMGKIIGTQTIAEFVEDEHCLSRLREIGVDYAQGYGIHRPEPWR